MSDQFRETCRPTGSRLATVPPTGARPVQDDSFPSAASESEAEGDDGGLQPLPPADRVRAVSNALADFIARKEMKPGDRLPAERELMMALAVGRSTVREVIRLFQARGVVESRKGSGTYLLRPISAQTFHMPLSFEASHLRDALLQTLDVRRGLEVEASMLAAERRTVEDLRVMEERLVEMERVHLEKGTAGREDLAAEFRGAGE